MFFTISRILLINQRSFIPVSLRFINNSSPITKGRYGIDQIDYIKSAVSNQSAIEWSTIRNNTLKMPGTVNEKNLDAVLLKLLVNTKNFDAALSYAEYCKRTYNELTLGCINGLLFLFYELSKISKLTSEQQAFILESYNSLYEKYKLLDSTTCERLLHALCAINEWKKALRVLDDIKFSGIPTHSAYSTLISTLFDNNKKGEALKLINRSISDNRPLQTKAFVSWINYIQLKYKERKTKLKYLEDICLHIFNNSVTINEESAQRIQDTYSSLGWNANISKIKKNNGECSCCRKELDRLNITRDEFLNLQKNIKDKLIVGSDLFLKTSPQELDRFLKFLDDTAPYDIVLDALNIAFIAKKNSLERVRLLNTVVNYFVNRNKKVLLLGRKHMLHWPKKIMSDILNKTCYFFTDDLTQDDPYFITAAILSGANTDIVSKDLLRGHRFHLKDKELALLFRRWQWQHQWMVFINKKKHFIIQPPLQFTPCAQKKDGDVGWHLPVENEDQPSVTHNMNDGVPDLSTWLCLRPRAVE